jgi:TRAP-type mannitol/chloroaromatic compound transport system permease small subunit
METLKRICRWIDTLNEWVGQGIAFITVGLVAVVFADVVMRYAFKKSSVVVQELEWHLFGLIFLLGAGYTLLHEGHVRVDVVYQRLKPRVRAWVNLIGVIAFLIPGCLMVIITSWKFTYNSWVILEGSPDPGGIPLRFIIKGAITIGFLLLFVQGIALGLRSLAAVLGEPEEKG